MKRFRMVSISMSMVLLPLAMAGSAYAIALPDSSSQNCPGANGCFKITNTNTGSGATAIVGVGSSFGTGVQGSGQTGVYGTSTSGNGVTGVSNSGIGGYFASNGTGSGSLSYAASNNGVTGKTGSSAFGIAGVKGVSLTGGSFGVAGYAVDTGYAIFGQNDSASGWAGVFYGNVWTSGSYQTSDVRLKKDIQDAPYGLAQLLKLRPVSFKWKKDADGDPRQLGLIAQEVQKIVPEVVMTDGPEGKLGVNYTALIPVMIRSVQDQQKLIQDQQKKLQEQETRIAALERGDKGGSVSSLVKDNLGAGLVCGLFPLGLVLAHRRKKEQAS